MKDIQSLYSTSIYQEVCELVFAERCQSAIQTREVLTFRCPQIIFSVTILIEEIPKLDESKIQLHLINQNISK